MNSACTKHIIMQLGVHFQLYPNSKYPNFMTNAAYLECRSEGINNKEIHRTSLFQKTLNTDYYVAISESETTIISNNHTKKDVFTLEP